jgi:hypothetical protein
MYIDKKQIAGANKMNKPCGNLLDMFLGLGL